MPMLRAVALVLILAAAIACGDDDPAPTTPTPTRQTISEDFIGTLTVNSARTHSFSTGSGAISVTVAELTPDSAAKVGVSLGIWNAAFETCQMVFSNDNAVQAASVVGTASAPGSFCARIYDVGTLSAPTDYKLTVVHF